MVAARLVVDRDFVVSALDRRVFGTFVEHLGRCVYTGIFEPGHPSADARGFRSDVLALVRELGPTVVRYPGGNFLSGYNWEDGVGPVEDRPARLDLAWFSTETNRFGTSEFIDWPRRQRRADARRQPGTRARRRAPVRRAATTGRHGAVRPASATVPAPRDVKLVRAARWTVRSRSAARPPRSTTAYPRDHKVMRWVDPGLQLAACGSSNHEMPTFAAWEDRVLSHCFDDVDLVSPTYFEPRARTAEFFGNIDVMDQFIHEIVAVADAVAPPALGASG
jgi:alpha-N-arabinofuranosidase